MYICIDYQFMWIIIPYKYMAQSQYSGRPLHVLGWMDMDENDIDFVSKEIKYLYW